MKSLFPKPLTSTPTCYSFALLTSFCSENSSSLIKHVPIVGYFHVTYCTMFTKWLKVELTTDHRAYRKHWQEISELFMPEGLCIKPWADLNLKLFASTDPHHDAVILKGIVSDSNNIILWHESEDINWKSLFPKFQLIPILRFQVMHDYVWFIASIDYCVE